MSHGMLDEEHFHHCCQLLLLQSQQLGDGWSWEVVQGSEDGYLKKTALRSISLQTNEAFQLQPATSCDLSSECDLCFETERHQGETCTEASLGPDSFSSDLQHDDDESSCSVTEKTGLVLQYEYHIMYSCSYSTPVLYFRAFTMEGRTLTLEEAWSHVHPHFRGHLQNSPLNVISQQEHPFLGQPFFVLHPCKTEEFMRPILQAAQDHNRRVNYVLSWLSVVGPVVGLNIPLKYSTDLHPVTTVSRPETG